jgi:hypothetical protein
MPIRYGFDPTRETAFGPGANFPVVICDQCGQRIRNIRDGVFLMNSLELRESGDTTQVYFAHRDGVDDANDRVNRCHWRLEKRLRDQGGGVGWEELAYFPTQLAANMTNGVRALAGVIPIVHRDYWLLKWVAAGMPAESLPGQPKAWNFSLADVRKFAGRIKKVLPRKEDNLPSINDDIEYGAFADSDDDNERDETGDDFDR